MRAIGLGLLVIGCVGRDGTKVVSEDSAAATGATTGLVGGTPTGSTGGTPGGTTTPSQGPDLRLRGSYPVTTVDGTLAVATGCDLAYTRYTAQGGPDVPIVVLTHGLQRTKAQMATLADHLASWGLDVVTPTSCAKDLWNIDQERNGADMVELAQTLKPGPAIYAGHSAGGLAAFVAASSDPQAAALLGLDMVESGGIGAGAVATLTAPTAGLVGDPGICNLSNNANGLYDAIPGAWFVRVTDADHCDFEHPTDAICTVACGTSPNDTFSEGEIASTITGLSTGWLLLQTGVEPTGAAWWTPGGLPYDTLLAAGAVGAP